MKKLAWTAGALGVGLSAMLGVRAASGADHRDSDLLAMSANSAADIDDVYAWMNSDASKLNLVMTIQPFAAADATFSPNVQYVFHVSSMSAYGAAATETKIICELASATSVQCWVGNDYVTGDPSNAAGLVSADAKIRVFAGQRKDPFFFNLDGFKQAVRDAEGVNPSTDATGCAQINAAQEQILVNDLTHDSNGTTATTTDTDDFATANGVALVMQIDKTLVSSGGPILGVWGATYSKP